ncbi:MAG: hypothetical protein AB7J35_04975 [Dehalococcoidia bacterium]
MAQATPIAGRRRIEFPSRRLIAGLLGLCLAAGLTVTMGWWAVLAPGATTPRDREIVIQPGTAEAIAKGYPVFQAGLIDLRPGGSLRIVNEDTVAHAVGWLQVAPGETGILNAPAKAGDYKVDCTIHPSGTLGFNLENRPSLWQALVGGLVTGATLGLIAVSVLTVASNLDTD